MATPRIYLSEATAVGQSLALPAQAFIHLIRVLRLSLGDAVLVFNGQGLRFSAELSQVTKRQAEVRLTEMLVPLPESPLSIHLGLVMSKGDRMDYALQKATELGVSQITPLLSQRCDLKLSGERQHKKFQHWQGVLASACEQSQRDCLPECLPITDLTTWVGLQQAEVKLVLHPRSQAHPLPALMPRSVSLLIGPEGGLTETEVAVAVQQGFIPWRLGPRVLRTETAPVAGLAVLQYLWGDFNSALSPTESRL